MTITTTTVFLTFLLFALGAATGEALSELPTGLLILPFLGAEMWLLGGAFVKVMTK